MSVRFTGRISNGRSNICTVCSIRIVFDVLGYNSDIRDKDAGELPAVLIFSVGLNT